jgi:imidazolonepropionase-like amidohydrolase
MKLIARAALALMVAAGGLGCTPGGEPAADGEADLAVAQVEVPAGGPVALVGGTVIPATGAPPIPEATVLIDGDGRITTVGPSAEVPVPDGVRTVPCWDAWITPGLVDAHIHFFQSGGVYTRPDIIDLREFRSYEDEQQGIRDRLDGTFRRTLASGVTAVVDVGGPFWNFDVRDQARAAELAPRVAVAGPLISTVSREQLDLGDPPIIKATSPEHARELVRAQLEREPDLIKIWFILPPSGDPLENIEIVRAVIEEAHGGGVRVAVHATQLETARAAVEAGAEILVHSIDDQPVDGAFVELLRKRGTLLTTTLVVYEGYAEVLGQDVHLEDIERRYGDPVVMGSWGELPTVILQAEQAQKNQARVTKLRSRAPVMQANLLTLVEAGVAVSAGTDAGNIGTLHGPSLHRELELMSAAGLTPAQVLEAATREAARVFAAEPEFGTVEAGKLADLLILDADPLADIHNLRRIRHVVLGGRVLDPGEILPANPEDVVQRQVLAYNARDVEAFVALYAEDTVVERGGDGELVAAGRDALRETYTELFETSPALHCAVLKRVVSGGVIVDHELVSGIRGGAPVRATAVYEVEGGLIQKVTLYRE